MRTTSVRHESVPIVQLGAAVALGVRFGGDAALDACVAALDTCVAALSTFCNCS